jgi:hypothetical protein
MRSDSSYIVFFLLIGKLIPRVKVFNAALVILLSFSFASLFAQPVIKSFNDTSADTSGISFPDERVFLITDREIYLCGENIVFEASVYEGNWFLPLMMSSVIYVELYSQNNLVISRGKFIIRDARCSGIISIPREISSDIYNIRAYTNYMKNFGIQQFCTQKIKIVNPFNDNSVYSDPSVEDRGRNGNGFPEREKSLINRLLYLNPLPKFRIDLNTNKEIYGSREKVEVSIIARNKEGLPVNSNFILFSCLVQDDKKESAFTYPDTGLPGQELKQIHSLRYLPEMKGDIISGRVVYNDNQPAKGVEVLQSFTGSRSWIESFITNEQGNFYFLTGTQNNKGDLILKLQNTDRETSVILDDEFFNSFPPPTKDSLRLTEDQVELISKQYINIQVDDAYSFTKKDSTGNTGDDELALYGKEYADYKFPDYIKLPNLKEFIFEIIEGVIISRENSMEVITIQEENTSGKIGPKPLMIIDGVPVTESSIVIGLPVEKVQSIRVVRNKYFYKGQIFDGILDIITYTQDASSFDLPKGTLRYNFIHANEENILIEPKISTDEAGRLPIYKNLLYWNSKVTTDKDGRGRISFLTPDNSGTFRIQCFGFTREGWAGEGCVTIVVGEN